MSNVIATYECLSLKNVQAQGKEGKLVKDEDGYYKDFVLGAFGVYNSAGQFYDAQAGKNYFDNDQDFKRKIENGYLSSELGHPKRQPGMNDREWLTRVMTTEETNTCAHIRRIKLVDGLLKDRASGRPTLTILGDVKPAGVHSSVLEDALNNKHENVAFSIRSFTRDSVESNKYVKRISRIITFDCVTSNGPGIYFANKHSSPSLESHDNHVFTESIIDQLVEDLSTGKVSMENNDFDIEKFRRDLFPVAKSKIMKTLDW